MKKHTMELTIAKNPGGANIYQLETVFGITFGFFCPMVVWSSPPTWRQKIKLTRFVFAGKGYSRGGQYGFWQVRVLWFAVGRINRKRDLWKLRLNEWDQAAR